MKKVEYVADGWAIYDIDTQSLIDGTNAKKVAEAKALYLDWLSNRLGYTVEWKRLRGEGYRCIRVYRKVSK